MIDRIRREPALIAGLVQAVLGLLVAFGLDVSAEQTASILAVTAALLAILTRAQVTPYVDVVEQLDGTEVVAGPANDIVGEGAVVRELTPELPPELVRHGDEEVVVSEDYVGEHRAD